MHRRSPLRWLLCLAALLPAIALARETGRVPTQAETMPGRAVVLRAGKGDRIVRIAAPIRRLAVAPAATITVSYNGFPADAQLAFQRAIDIWSGLISSPVPIHVVATWEPLGAGVLGSAGPTTFAHDFLHAPLPNTWYPVALANALAGSDLNGGTQEIDASFNSTFNNWYLGTDGQTPLGEYDLVSVVLHELGHGLGIVDSMKYNDVGGIGSWGLGGRSLAFDRFVVNGAGQQLVDTGNFPNPSAALGAQLVGDNLFFGGAQATAAGGGTRPKLYAPNPFEPGSSIAHVDPTTYPSGSENSLMRPALEDGSAIHDPGPITLGMFRDLGWTTAEASDTPIAGLAATNDGPTTLGNPTSLTAAISAGTNVSYAWDFGDGTSSSGASPTHTYASIGQYQARVTASNTRGSATATTTVTVMDAPIAGLQASANGPTNLGNPTTSTATVAGGTNVIYIWDFGDGTSGSGATVAHAYTQTGNYTASVTASNTRGSSIATVGIQVLPSSQAAVVTSAGGTLTTPDGSFSATFPAGAVAQTVNVTYTARLTPGQPLPAGLALLRDFTLEARTGAGAALSSFAQPYTLDLGYTDAEVAARRLAEPSLRVLRWNGSSWVDVLPCAGCAVDTTGNHVALALSDVGEFAVVGAQLRTVFLPVMLR